MIQSTIISERDGCEPITLNTLLKSTILNTFATERDQDDFHIQMQQYLRPHLGKPFLAIVEEAHYSPGITPGDLYTPTRRELRLGTLSSGPWVCTSAGTAVSSKVEVRIPMKEYNVFLDMSCRNSEWETVKSRIWEKKEGNLLISNEDLCNFKLVRDSTVIPLRYVKLVSGERDIISVITSGRVSAGITDYLNGARRLGWQIGPYASTALIQDLYFRERNNDTSISKQRVEECIEFNVHRFQKAIEVQEGVHVTPNIYLKSLAIQYNIDIPPETIQRPQRV